MMTTIERASFGGNLWLSWVLASAVAGAVTGPAARALSVAGKAGVAALGEVAGEAVTGAVLLGLVLGAIAVAQWLVLRSQVSWAGWLMLATAVAAAAGGALVLGVWKALSVSGHGGLGVWVGVVLGLAVFGLAQWLVLERVVSWARWWALVSVVGLVAAGPLGGALAGVLSRVTGAGEVTAELIYGATFGAVYGAVTGGELVWLLRHHG